MNHSSYSRRAIAFAVTALALALSTGSAAAYPLEAGTRADSPLGANHDPQLRQALRVDAATSPEAARAVSGERDFTSIDRVGADVGVRNIAPADRAIVLRQPPSLPTVVPASSGDGFDWADAGIGALGAFGLVLGLAGGSAIVLRRRRLPVAAA